MTKLKFLKKKRSKNQLVLQPLNATFFTSILTQFLVVSLSGSSAIALSQKIIVLLIYPEFFFKFRNIEAKF